MSHAFEKVQRILIDRFPCTLCAPFVILAACSWTEPKLQSATNYEYATFYAEFADDFIAPISADTPTRYTWTTSAGSFNTNDIAELWRHLGVSAEQDYSFTYIEVVLINHLTANGWELLFFDISSVFSKRKDFQTIYHYIFRQSKRSH